MEVEGLVARMGSGFHSASARPRCKEGTAEIHFPAEGLLPEGLSGLTTFLGDGPDGAGCGEPLQNQHVPLKPVFVRAMRQSPPSSLP